MEAVAVWNELKASDAALVTSDAVLTETFFVHSILYGAKAARDVARKLVASRELWIVATVDLAPAALDRLIAYERDVRKPRERPSYFDCTSFEIMRQLGIRRAFTFDRHFREAGFTTIPGPA